ncbi:MAG: transcription termination/antitermination protein NusA, partial [Litoricolaceae bacterium]|nr:transcription termination/antitermination protein NusA [Litorivicinaceae bacterium]
MGSKEILQVVELFSNEKGIPKSIVFEAIEQALATATRKRFEEEEADIRVAIDRSTGEYDTFRRWVVVPDDHLAILGSELTTEEAAEIDPSLNVGDEYEIEVESSEFGRIEAQTAKQVIVQKVREAEREKVVADYESRLMSLINGSVKKVTRDSEIVDLGGAAEALLP